MVIQAQPDKDCALSFSDQLCKLHIFDVDLMSESLFPPVAIAIRELQAHQMTDTPRYNIAVAFDVTFVCGRNSDHGTDCTAYTWLFANDQN